MAKYVVGTNINGEYQETVISCRTDAKQKTLVEKAVYGIMDLLGVQGCKYSVEYPNVWLNGAVGTLIVVADSEKYFVGIRGEWSDTFMYCP